MGTSRSHTARNGAPIQVKLGSQAAKDGLRALERDGYTPEMHLQHMTERSAEALFKLNASLAFDPPERKLHLAEWEQRVYVPHSPEPLLLLLLSLTMLRKS